MKEWLRWKNLDVAVLWCWGSLLATGWVVPRSHRLKQLPRAICTSSVFTCLNQFLHQSSHSQTSRQMFHCRYTNRRLEGSTTYTHNCVANGFQLAAPTGSDIWIHAFDGLHMRLKLESAVTPIRNKWWTVEWMHRWMEAAKMHQFGFLTILNVLKSPASAGLAWSASVLPQIGLSAKMLIWHNIQNTLMCKEGHFLPPGNTFVF